jgi:hypothetical protein
MYDCLDFKNSFDKRNSVSFDTEYGVLHLKELIVALNKINSNWNFVEDSIVEQYTEFKNRFKIGLDRS